MAAVGLGVYEVRPGIIATDMTGPVKDKVRSPHRGSTAAHPPLGHPLDDVGRAVAAIAHDLLPFSTGEVLNVDGGFHLRTVFTGSLTP